MLQRIGHGDRPAFSLRFHLAGLTMLCVGLVACAGTNAQGSPGASRDDAGPQSDAAAEGETQGDDRTEDASDGPLGRSAPSEADGGLGDAPGDDGGAELVDAPGDAQSSPLDAGADSTLLSPPAGDAAPDANDAASGTLGGGDAAPPSPAAATAYLGNPAHTSSVVDPSLAPPLAAIWSFEPGLGLSISYPLIAGGRVYFIYTAISPQSGPQLIAVDEHTGTTIWGPVDLATPYLADEAYDGERVFTMDAKGLVRAFDAATGAPSWTYSVGSLPPTVAPTAYRGLVYVAGSAAVTALDEVTGQVRWTVPIASAGLSAPAVTEDGVFVSAGCGDVYALDRTTGSLLWHHLPTCNGFSRTPAVFERRVYVPDDGMPPGQTDVFDAQNGGLIATLPCFISPAFDNGRAYCNQRTPLQAFDLTTGMHAWSVVGDDQLNLGPFAAGGTVYVASDTGRMFGVDESTGAIAWSSEADRLGAAGPTVAGEGILLTALYGGGGVVAYAHVDVPDASVVLGDGAASTPFTLIPSTNPIALALDGTNVYWADFGAEGVALAPKGGGAPVPLWSSKTTPPRALAVDATNVYFVASGNGSLTPSAIVSIPIAGGSASTLASSPALLTGPIVAGPSAVYWVDGAVWSVPKAGGTVTSVVPGVPAAALAVDASNLYWSASDGLHKMPFSGGADALLGVPADPEPKALGRGAATAIAVDGTNVYYAMNSAAGPGSIGYVPIAGGPATVLASGRIGRVVAIAFDARNVYWAEGDGTIQQGAIAGVPKTGGRVTVLVSGLSGPVTLAADSTGVYFQNVGGGIGKIAN